MARQTPYTNFHDLNLDWIIKRIQNVYNDENPPPYPVRTVNGQVGNVHLTGDDIPVSPNDNTEVSTALASKYVKPSGGIPKSDLSAGVQSYLNAIADKLDKPSVAGQAGQVLTSDGNNGQSWQTPVNPVSIIDDASGYGVSDKTWSAGKLFQMEADILDLENDKLDEPAVAGTEGQVLEINSYGDPVWSDSLNIIKDELTVVSENRFNTSLQTSVTISPYYYVDGAIYNESSYLNNNYHCTAPFEITPNTVYSIGYIPAYNNNSKPWGSATEGIFFYDESMNYISDTPNTTFTTPANAKYARFNYRTASPDAGLTLLKERTVLVYGSDLPDEYSKYEPDHSIINDVITKNNFPLVYDISGDILSIQYPYANEKVTVTMKKHGGNNLFDYYSIVGSASGDICTDDGDWHSPYRVRAVNNGDGDHPTDTYFTGGNHRSNNNSTGGGATARTTSLKFFVDGREKTEGNGIFEKLDVCWTNLIQGYNTSKDDGTGREILQANHTVSFYDGAFHEFVELIPLEDIQLITWYGLEGYVKTGYSNTIYCGAVNRLTYPISSTSKSGDITAYRMEHFGLQHKMIMEIDPMFDLGKRTSAQIDNSNITNGMFTSGNKAYYSIVRIDPFSMNTGTHYFLKGEYKFVPVSVE